MICHKTDNQNAEYSSHMKHTCWNDVKDTRCFLHSNVVAAPTKQSAVVKFCHGSVGGRATGSVHGEVRSGNVDDFGRVVEFPGEVNAVLRIRVQLTKDLGCFLSGDPVHFLLT